MSKKTIEVLEWILQNYNGDTKKLTASKIKNSFNSFLKTMKKSEYTPSKTCVCCDQSITEDILEANSTYFHPGCFSSATRQYIKLGIKS